MEESSGPPRSLHDTILRDIEERILSGEWPPGHSIPSELELTEIYGCSRMTVNKAMTQLAQAGLILRRRRVGSVVLAQRSQTAILEIHDVKDDVAARGGQYDFAILSREERAATEEEAEEYGVADHSVLLHVLCLHRSDGAPFALEDRLIFLDTVPQARETVFELQAPGIWLLSHIPWSAAENRISALAANEREAKMLDVADGEPCLVITRRTWKQGDPVTVVRFTYPGRLHELCARFTPIQSH